MKKTFFSAVVLILFVSVSVSFSSPRNVLIEYVTGTWCGNCPCGHQTLNTIQNQYPQTIVLAYHAFSNDPYRNFNGSNIVNLMGFSGTPTADIDRNYFLGNSNYPLWITSAQNVYNATPDSKVDIVITSKSFNPTTRELNLNINSIALENLTGQYKINVVITEDNLISPQNFYSQCGTPGYVNNYEHDNVVRNMVNGATGENLNTENIWNSNQIISKSISTVLDPQWIYENCKVAIFVYKEEATLALSKIQQAIQDNVTGVIGISGTGTEIAGGYYLSQNYPNPFNPETHLEFGISKLEFISLKVYDMLGNEIKTLVNEYKPAGNHSVTFDATDYSSGVYYYKITAGSFGQVKRMVLVK